MQVFDGERELHRCDRMKEVLVVSRHLFSQLGEVRPPSCEGMGTAVKVRKRKPVRAKIRGLII
jgi:hypothetical protein